MDVSVWNFGGGIFTGENSSTRRKTCPSATLFTINPTHTRVGQKPGHGGEKPATNRLSRGDDLKLRNNKQSKEVWGFEF
jgi:hypothetical protein